MNFTKNGLASRNKLKTASARKQGIQFELTDSFIKKCEKEGKENVFI